MQDLYWQNHYKKFVNPTQLLTLHNIYYINNDSKSVKKEVSADLEHLKRESLLNTGVLKWIFQVSI
jgi:hypothetical protein